MEQKPSPIQRSLLTFHLGEFLFGIDLDLVGEVLNLDELRPVPGAPAGLLGLANFHGQIISIVELRNRFALLPFENDADGEMIVAKVGDRYTGFAVDSVAGPVKVSDADFEPLPKAISARYQRLVEGVFKLPNQLLLVLNVESASALGERPMSESFAGNAF